MTAEIAVQEGRNPALCIRVRLSHKAMALTGVDLDLMRDAPRLEDLLEGSCIRHRHDAIGRAVQNQRRRQSAIGVEPPRDEAEIDHNGLHALILLSRGQGQAAAQRNPEHADSVRIDRWLTRYVGHRVTDGLRPERQVTADRVQRSTGLARAVEVMHEKRRVAGSRNLACGGAVVFSRSVRPVQDQDRRAFLDSAVSIRSIAIGTPPLVNVPVETPRAGAGQAITTPSKQSRAARFIMSGSAPRARPGWDGARRL